MVNVVNRDIEEQQSTMFVYFAGDIYNDKKNYLEYKNGVKKDYSSDEISSLLIIELLDKNGFSLDCLGTYLYKDVIKNVIECMKNPGNNLEKLRMELSNPYSQFYFDISRNDRDMGVNTFHSYIEEAILNIQFENKTFNLLDIMCRGQRMNYGDLAYEIASYMLNSNYVNSDVQVVSDSRPNIKKLTSVKKTNKIDS